MLKILYFSGDQQFFQILPAIKFLNNRGRELFIYQPGRHDFRPGRHFQQNYRQWKPPRRILPGHLDRVFELCNNWHSLLKQFPQIQQTNFATLFSSENIKREKGKFQQIKLLWPGLFFRFTQETRSFHITLIFFLHVTL